MSQLESELAAARGELETARHERKAALAAESKALEAQAAALVAERAAEERAVQHAEERERAEAEAAKARVDAQRWVWARAELAKLAALWVCSDVARLPRLYSVPLLP